MKVPVCLLQLLLLHHCLQHHPVHHHHNQLDLQPKARWHSLCTNLRPQLDRTHLMRNWLKWLHVNSNYVQLWMTERSFPHALDPMYAIPSRKTLSHQMIPSLYDRERAPLQERNQQFAWLLTAGHDPESLKPCKLFATLLKFQNSVLASGFHCK